jgi:hypothetical protein
VAGRTTFVCGLEQDTVYPVMADPPSEVGGFHQNSIEPSCARGKDTMFGAVGTVAMLSILNQLFFNVSNTNYIEYCILYFI